ncbi:MAG: phage virion morphogenesis protein [Paramuribaculum sp.]|nr:phage virion morphogenesis protein [Paramuribaculum sp.]
MNRDLERALQRMMQDIKIELADEFDRNFERQGFFNEAWQRRRSPLRPGAAILSGNRLRWSIRAEVRGMSIVFTSDHPAAGIHNEGGEIVVTARMKRFFWAKYYEATGGIAKRKNGEQRQTKRNMQISTEAQFWRAMALIKAGNTIKIPRRRFIGEHPEVEKCCSAIITKALDDYFNELNITKQ